MYGGLMRLLPNRSDLFESRRGKPRRQFPIFDEPLRGPREEGVSIDAARRQTSRRL